MNRPALASSREEIVLSQESPFALAATQVRPGALESEHAGRVVALEPRVMKVLVALQRAGGAPVSRDRLIELCWGGRVVTESALNRCVAHLRKALGADPRIRVETIPTIGYRLLLAPEGTAVAVETNAAPPARAIPRRRWMWIAAGGGLAAIAAIAIAALPRPVTWTAVGFQPLTSDPGLETYPALSPNGEQIVYAAKAEPSAPRDLYLRNVSQGTPLRITSDEADDYGASWSPAGDRIAFARSPVHAPCSVVVVPVPLGPERVVTHCQTANQTRPSWLNDRTLLIFEPPHPGDLSRIRTVDVETGAVRDLTSPPATTLGDTEPQASPDGRYVLFRRTLMVGADDLYLLDVANGEQRALTSDGWKVTSYAWSADRRHVFFSSNRGGEFGLWSIDIRAGQPPRQMSLGLGAVNFSRVSADRNNHLAVELNRGRTNLALLSLSGSVQPVTANSGSDGDATVAADGTIAYVSNRGGSYEIWVKRPASEPVRLTSIVGSYVARPTWSPDGEEVTFVALRGRSCELYSVMRDGSQLRQLTHDGVEKRDPAYAAEEDKIYYIERNVGGWRLMQIALAPGSQPQKVAGGEGWRVLHRGADGRMYGQRTAENVIRVLGSADLPGVEIADGDAWTVGSQGIYVKRSRRGDAPTAIWLHSWNGEQRKLADTPHASGSPHAAGSLAIAPDGAVIFSEAFDQQTDLGLLRLRSES